MASLRQQIDLVAPRVCPGLAAVNQYDGKSGADLNKMNIPSIYLREATGSNLLMLMSCGDHDFPSASEEE